MLPMNNTTNRMYVQEQHAQELPEKNIITNEEYNNALLSFLPENCTYPRKNTYVNNQYGAILELNGQTLSSDLQVLREISGYGGVLNSMSSDIQVSDSNLSTMGIDEFYLSPNADKARDPFLGRPTDTRIKQMTQFDDTIVAESSTESQIPRATFAEIEKHFKDLFKPFFVGEGVCAGDTCQCQLGAATPVWSTRAVMLSSKNHQKLYEKLKKAGIIAGIRKFIVYPPNGALCMCSWIGTDLGGRFATFSERKYDRRARQEINLERVLDDENDEFVKQVWDKINHLNNQRTVNTFANIMKKRAYVRHTPLDERNAPSMPADPDLKYENTNFATYFGTGMINNPDMGAAVRNLSNPYKSLNQDAKIMLGLDFTRQASQPNVLYG